MKPRILPIIQKEFLHIIRDSRSLMIIFILPILMILLYGYAITFDIKEIHLGILDEDQTSASRELLSKLTSSNYFKVTAHLKKRGEIEEAMLRRKMLAALVIPVGFSKTIDTEPLTSVQLLVDGAHSNAATVAINYMKSFLLSYSLEHNAAVLRPPIQIEPRIWYNPELTSSIFIVPGLVAVIMMLICALLTSVTIARERETGTMEQILVSPIRPLEIIFGKIAPYILLALADAMVIILCAKLIFKVPFRGTPLLLLLGVIVYIYAALSLGVFISARVKTQQIAMMLAQLSTTLPSIMLSGFIFPILSMPKVLQFISYLVPARYFLVIIRGIMLKGLGWHYFYHQIIFLLVFGTALLLISVKRFKINLEG
ncbi:MAG: ABC transporter permease [candidate division KSB1 bacterium]|nr:ABC transporter permease [candidate division KSB1 bacterium]MDZ7317653.1 ABC transporter permease [candidate division KSB1 bacterium]MDZ7341896.1 ABC transporter permease [candidate division KSB1 bacterium]